MQLDPGSLTRYPPTRLRPLMLRAGALLLALTLAGCASGGATVQPDQVDFGGNGLSHGHP